MAKKGSTAYVGINANTKGFEMGLRRLTRGFSNLNRGGGRLATGGLQRGFSGLVAGGVAGLGALGLGFGFAKLVQTFAKWSPEFNKAFVGITSALRDTIRPYVEEFGEFLLTNLPAIKDGLKDFVGFIADTVDYWANFSWDQLWKDIGFLGEQWVAIGKDIARGFKEYLQAETGYGTTYTPGADFTEGGRMTSEAALGYMRRTRELDLNTADGVIRAIGDSTNTAFGLREGGRGL
jgi:hypothetical protein